MSFSRVFRKLRKYKYVIKKAQATAQAAEQTKAAEQAKAAETAAATQAVATQPPVQTTAIPVQTTGTPVDQDNDSLDLYINTMRNRRKRGAQLPDVAALLGQTATLGV